MRQLPPSELVRGSPERTGLMICFTSYFLFFAELVPETGSSDTSLLENLKLSEASIAPNR